MHTLHFLGLFPHNPLLHGAPRSALPLPLLHLLPLLPHACLPLSVPHRRRLVSRARPPIVKGPLSSLRRRHARPVRMQRRPHAWEQATPVPIQRRPHA